MKILKNEKIIRIELIIMLMLALILGCMGNNYSAEVNNKDTQISILYNSHIQDIGWEKDFSKKDGETSGTSGKSKRLEAIKIKLNVSGINIKYQTHIQDIGWQDWKQDGELSGTSGQRKRLEAIKIKLENTDKYSVMYRVHIQDIGWQDWKYDGDLAGTTGQSKRLEAIEIKIVEKVPHVQYSAHIQDIGWQDWKQDGKSAGTTGQRKRLEAMKIKATNLPNNVSIKYQTHIQDIGWQDWKKNEEITGTTGKNKRLEAIRIKLEGTENYSIMYRVHVQDIGWQEWCYDGETSGTSGQSKRLEAIEIKIVPKIKERKVKICIDDPSTNNISNTTQKIKGWMITSVKDTKLQILIDNKEIDLTNLKRKARPDVLNVTKGYGDENVNNKTPGFEIDVDFSKYQLGKHTITIRTSDEKGTIKEENKEIILKEKITYSTGTYGKTGLKVKGNSRGTDLKYYKYGNGPNVFFATFAIHGYEDIWSKDGQELVTIANNFYQRLIGNNDYNIAEKWTIYIFPGVNQDGLNYGTTNNGPGRTTLYSQAPNNKGIDLNRCWQIGSEYTRYTDNRNYNGTTGFQAYEAQYLRDFLLANKSKNGQTILVDLHGWTQQVIGDSGICSYYSKQFPENDKSAVGRYGTGYLINWARSSLGSTTKSARTALIELPNRGVTGHQSVINQNFSNRYIQATLDMLKNI